MSVLSSPRHPLVRRALAIATAWCHGHVIDDAPALSHAVRVAVVLTRHVPHATAELVAAVLLHDGPEFAPPGDLDLVLGNLGPEVLRVVRAMQAEHDALGQGDPAARVAALAASDPGALLAVVADNIVAFNSLLRRADASGDPDGFWARRQPFIQLLPYFRLYAAAATRHIPDDMARALTHELAAVTCASSS